MSESKPPIELTVDWKGKLLFESAGVRGRRALLDGDSAQSQSPMEALLGALCGCIAIDVVMILEKMRLAPESLRIEARGLRRDQPPRYFTDVDLKFIMAGEAPPEKVERAIQLSFDKYCSVFHSLRQDLRVRHEVVYADAETAARQ